VGWASTCNSVGQTAGYFLGNVVFLALESKDFANRYIRQPFQLELQSTGLITLPGKILILTIFIFVCLKVFFFSGVLFLEYQQH
jgi:PAT family acetyl-CoA transporter-like MFS transporter 1